MLVYFYSSDRNGNKKMSSRCFWYITGDKIIKKGQAPSRSGSDPAGNFCVRSAQSPACSAPSAGPPGIVDAGFEALVFYESVIIFALHCYNIIRSLSRCQG